MSFKDLKLITPILKALDNEGYVTPTPIQKQAIPVLLEGRDLLGCAQTGTGKTAAFALPILQTLHNDALAHADKLTNKRNIQALILTPTRELALQISESFEAYGKFLDLKTTVIFGGVSQKVQTDALAAGVDILVATPGRLLDLYQQKFINLHHVRLMVLDEADRMLDMGFLNDVKKILGHLPQRRQNMLFSATIPPEISRLIDSILVDPVKLAVTPVSSTIDTVEQYVYFVDKQDKKYLLTHLLKDKKNPITSAVVFSRTKHGADKIARVLVKSGIMAYSIHGDKAQGSRQLALNNFKCGKAQVLVATDIVSRGIDIEELSHVINYDLPNMPETYVHRIGRTGRAGLGGVAISFCDEEEKKYLKDIEKLIKMRVTVVNDHPYLPGSRPAADTENTSHSAGATLATSDSIARPAPVRHGFRPRQAMEARTSARPQTRDHSVQHGQRDQQNQRDHRDQRDSRDHRGQSGQSRQNRPDRQGGQNRQNVQSRPTPLKKA